MLSPGEIFSRGNKSAGFWHGAQTGNRLAVIQPPPVSGIQTIARHTIAFAPFGLSKGG
jgi:hypothetical protein